MPARPQEQESDAADAEQPSRWSLGRMRRGRRDDFDEAAARRRLWPEEPVAPRPGARRVQPDLDFWAERPVRGRQRILIRRRRVLLALLTITLVTTLTALAGGLAWWAAGVAGACTLGYLLHLRVQVRQTAEFDRRREAARARLRARQRRIDSAERVVAVRLAREDERVASLAAAEDDLRAREEAERAAAERAAARAWEPVPVPLPTYVTKPKAVRPTQRSRPAWAGDEPQPSAQRPAEAVSAGSGDSPFDQEHQPAQPVAPAAGSELWYAEQDAPTVEIEHRRAVND